MTDKTDNFAPLIGAYLALAAIAPVLPGRVASTPGRFIGIYALLMVLLFGGAIGLAYYRAVGGADAKEVPDNYRFAVMGGLPLVALASLVIGIYAASASVFQRAGSVVFGVSHSALSALMAWLMLYTLQALIDRAKAAKNSSAAK